MGKFYAHFMNFLSVPRLKFFFVTFLLVFGFASANAQIDPPSLSFSPNTLSFSVAQNGSTDNQTTTLSSSDLLSPPLISLTKSENSSWLLLPTDPGSLAVNLGPLSFGVNATDLVPGTYTSTVTASSVGYTDATLQVTLEVTPVLSFSPTSLSFTVVQNGSTAAKISTLSASTGTPTVHLSSNSNWLVLPSAELGELSFGINADGLAVGTYNATVTASASGYTDATLQITLTVTEPPILSFSPTSLSFNVVQNGTAPNQSSTLSANTGSPTVTLSKSANWIVLPANGLGSLSFGIDATGLAVGT
jgi:hypothetical protein